MAGLRGYLDSLGGRLLLRLLLAVAVVVIVYLFLNLSTAQDRWRELTYHNAQRTSQLIERATRYGMLLNRKEDVHETIRRIAETPEVAGVRIFDKNGRVIFSADESEIGHQVDLRAEACHVCHEAPGAPARAVPDPPVREFRRADGELTLGLINPIRNAAECSNAACHAHPTGQQVLGVLDVQMSLVSAQQALADISRRAVSLTLLLGTALAVVCAIFVHRLVHRPILELERATHQIAVGNLADRVKTPGKGELASLASSFNRMTEDLQMAREELTTWSRTLEEKVLEKTRELNQTQRRIVQIEKMVSLGRLSATVAHELNNPLSGILTYAKLVGRNLASGVPSDEELEECRRFLGVIQQESARCGDIVKNLLIFARKTSADFAPERLNQILERSLMLVNHSIELAHIELDVRPLSGDDQIVCDANQLEQALVAVLINAIEAMPDGGSLRVRTRGGRESLTIVVEDTGIGIPPEHLPQVFEPFFSTKHQRFGVGLGLSVVYGIVRRHGGRIDVRSAPEQGTAVTIELPRTPPPGQADSRPGDPESTRLAALVEAEE